MTTTTAPIYQDTTPKPAPWSKPGTWSPVVPERTLVQRQEALKRANDIRLKRAQLKRDIKAGRESVFGHLLAPPEYIETMKLWDLLISQKKWGRVKVNKILVQCRISPSKTIGGMSVRQRTEIASFLRRV